MKRIIAALAFSTSAMAATINLLPQQGVTLLGVSCGGVHTSTYVTGFLPDGNITGEVYAWTRCGQSGRGGRTRTYSSWHSIEWDLGGVAVATLAYDGLVPDVTFTETDGAGNVISTVPVATSYGAAYIGRLEQAPDVEGG